MNYRLPISNRKRSKYGSHKIVVDGVSFDSKKEWLIWSGRLLELSGGLISGLKRQVPYVLAPPVKLLGEKRTKPELRYMADIVYTRNGLLVVEDVKSAPTRKKESYRIKKHLMKSVHGIDVVEV